MVSAEAEQKAHSYYSVLQDPIQGKESLVFANMSGSWMHSWRGVSFLERACLAEVPCYHQRKANWWAHGWSQTITEAVIHILVGPRWEFKLSLAVTATATAAFLFCGRTTSQDGPPATQTQPSGIRHISWYPSANRSLNPRAPGRRSKQHLSIQYLFFF